MVEASPEESVTVPEVVGIGKLAFMVSVGTGMGWVEGHFRVPSLWALLRAICERWLSLSIFCAPLASLATQSGKMMRSPSTPPLHRVGGSAEPALSSLVPPPPQYHLTRAPLTSLSAMILRSLAKG